MKYTINLSSTNNVKLFEMQFYQMYQKAEWLSAVKGNEEKSEK